jgi:3-oxoacyl-[acyl-carrier protein] reductase
MQIDLSGKVAVVTGAAGELGRVISKTLADCGAHVALCYNANKDGAEKLLGELRSAGRRAMAVQADITKPEAIAAIQRAVQKELGDADIIVNNAVIQYTWTTVLEQSLDDYESQFRSCVMQNVMMAKAFVPAMIQKKAGRVIGINTECAMQCSPTFSAYIAGKRGMDGVLRVLAREVGPHGITVNQVAPGWMISDKYRQAHTESQPYYEKEVPLHRRGDDQDIANAVAFLASDLAGFISGVYLPVCGGNVMPCI